MSEETTQEAPKNGSTPPISAEANKLPTEGAKKPKKKRIPKKYTYKDGEIELSKEIHNLIYSYAPKFGTVPQYLVNFDMIEAHLKGTIYAGFLEFLKKERKVIMEGFEKRQKEGVCTFDDLLLMFKEDQEVLLQSTDFPAFGAKITKVELRWYWGLTVRITYQCICSGSGTPVLTTDHHSIWSWSGIKKLSSLSVQLLTPEKKAELSKRGEKYRDYVSKPTHLFSTGNLMIKGWFGYVRFKNKGRIMVDARAMKQADPDYYRHYSDDEGEQAPMDKIPDELLWMCESRVFGFSFNLKKWGEMNIEELQEVEYRRDAYQRLVLDEEVKKATLALVHKGNQGFTDVIDGKGGGCIFLLHGNPGLGKTMTAEAIADYLGRPLYSVSAGELGVKPRQLEDSLRNILDTAANWNAVILLDEADVYLEQRDERDIIRNAMVGVFLRMLEYHSGVMFLTTNRVKNFDKAFFSRISMILHYPDMTPHSRAKVWTNLLEAAGITIHSTERLAALNLNGRQIKNIIRAAQALSDKKEVTEEELFSAYRTTTEGASDIFPAK